MTAKETQATIERVRRVSSGLQRLDLGVHKSLAKLKPGQYVLAALSDSWDPYLPQVWTPVALEGGKVTVECPVDDHYSPGEAVTLLGPVGKPFAMRPGLRNLLLMALDAPLTSLTLLASLAVRSKIGVTLVRSGEATRYPLDELPKEVEVLEGDLETGWPNQVMTVGWADQIIAVANPMVRDSLYKSLLAKIRELRADIPKRYILGIFDQPIPCGVGACHGCCVSHENGYKRVCIDGPALDLTQVILT